MFVEESKWIADQIRQNTKGPKTLLDVGGDSVAYRTKQQPHIQELYANLPPGFQVTTLDIDPTAHADITWDITKPPQKDMGQYDVVIAANILEHIEKDKLNQAITNIFALAKPNTGIVILTVPCNIALHYRPIDNGLRPTPSKLKALVKRHCITSERIICKHYKEPYLSQPTLEPQPLVTGGVFKNSSISPPILRIK